MTKKTKKVKQEKKAGKRKLVPMDFLCDAADCLKVLAHPVRLRIVDILMDGEFAVKEISRKCEISPNQTCEHLRLLKGHGLLKSERRGRSVFYSIANPRLPSLLECLKATDCGTTQ